MAYGDYINGDAGSKLFLFQDLANPRLTWRLYDQRGPSLILTGFYINNSSFAISQSYSKGMGDTIETAVRSRMRDAMRALVRQSRDMYNHREDLDAIKNKASELVLGSLDDLVQYFGASQDNVFSKANQAVQNFELDKEWEAMLRYSKVVTQGDKSALFDTTDISIPNISSLNCTIWSTPSAPCRTIIENIYKSYFLGEFHKIDNEGGGYWEAPNKLNLGSDDPLSQSDVDGSFMLRAGPYLFKNLLLKKFEWEYSKEFMAKPEAPGGIPKATNEPAYARCSIDLENYKYKTNTYLTSTFVPGDNGINESVAQDDYNKQG